MMHFSRTPSLEVNWLPNSDRKGLPTPMVAFADLDWCSGCFLPAGIRYESLESTGSRDVLVISTRHGARPATIAHEHRHFQQHYLPSLPRLFAAESLDFGVTFDSWCAAIRKFYRGRPFEMDALRYERRHVIDEQNEASFEALRQTEAECT